MTSAVKQAGLYMTGIPQWLEAFHLIAEEDGQRIAELESERDNAWEELREIRAAISANPEESTLDEVVKLCQQLATFHSAVEHVTEDGCTRRSVVAMPEGWAMVHKDRLHDLELAEEQLSAAQSEIESAFREGFRSPATYNDVLVNCEDDEWENYKRGMK